MSQRLSQSFETLFGKMETVITSKTVVGEPVTFGNVIIVPLVDVSFGVAAGGSANETKGGEGGGLGAKISPSAVLVVVNDTVQLVNVKDRDSVNKLIDMAPGLMAKLGSFFSKDQKESKETPGNGTVSKE